MMTWGLWRILQIPSPHPIFRRTIRASTSQEHLGWIIPLVGLLGCCASWNWAARSNPSISLVVLFIAIFFSATFYVVGWVVETSTTIAKEHERGTYDQISLPPAGALGASWAICSASIHRNDTFGWIVSLRTWTIGGIALVTLAILFTSTFLQSGPNVPQFVLILTQIMSLIFLSYLDHIQSIIQGCMVGMIVPTFVYRRPDVRFLSMTVFLLSQLTFYFAWALVSFVFLPFLYTVFNINGWLADLSLTIFRVAAFYLLREGVILLLWRSLVDRLNADSKSWIYFDRIT